MDRGRDAVVVAVAVPAPGVGTGVIGVEDTGLGECGIDPELHRYGACCARGSTLCTPPHGISNPPGNRVVWDGREGRRRIGADVGEEAAREVREMLDVVVEISNPWNWSSWSSS
jgi:hypothetical protein